MILNGKPVGFILDSGNQLKTLRAGIDGELHIVEVKPPGPVKVILHHAAHRNIQPQLFHHPQGHIHLSPASVHHDQIREGGKAAQLLIQLFFLQLLLLLQAVGEAPGQHLLQAGVVIGTLHGFDLEFPVITALRLSFFVNYHGANGFKTADIGNIVGFHPDNSG